MKLPPLGTFSPSRAAFHGIVWTSSAWVFHTYGGLGLAYYLGWAGAIWAFGRVTGIISVS